MKFGYRLLLPLLALGAALSTQAAEKPNILVIWGDDIVVRLTGSDAIEHAREAEFTSGF